MGAMATALRGHAMPTHGARDFAFAA